MVTICRIFDKNKDILEQNTGQAVTISFSAINDVYITLSLQCTCILERMAFYERLYAMKSQRTTGALLNLTF